MPDASWDIDRLVVMHVHVQNQCPLEGRLNLSRSFKHLSVGHKYLLGELLDVRCEAQVGRGDFGHDCSGTTCHMRILNVPYLVED